MMMELMNNMEGTTYPEMIRGLPEIDTPVAGVQGWLLQGGETQAVFMDIEADTEIPPHSHCTLWGVVVSGEMSLTIGGETRTYRAGDWYYIAEGVDHSATCLSRVNLIDVFNEGARYQPKPAD